MFQVTQHTPHYLLPLFFGLQASPTDMEKQSIIKEKSWRAIGGKDYGEYNAWS
jgi:hypothetical protein